MGSVNPSIDLAHDGDIAVVTVDNPPVNALKHEVRAGLIEALPARSANDAGVKADRARLRRAHLHRRRRHHRVRQAAPQRPA